MEKYITDERTGLKYELVGDYYLIAGDDEPEERPIGIWGQRHLRYLKQHRKTVYAELLTSSKLNSYLADLNEQAIYFILFSKLNGSIIVKIRRMIWNYLMKRFFRNGLFSFSRNTDKRRCFFVCIISFLVIGKNRPYFPSTLRNYHQQKNNQYSFCYSFAGTPFFRHF